ncbi:MAG: nitroreductase family protein [Candidatus Omnitrophica bacterium]|nr:nitroreductase family protein [Candidatus Omnitrophota bacterium]MCB9746986.1 nitroreductase family protein [Candidatus Omnitrophota bacterium]
MNTIDAIKQRRAIKHYDSQHEMSNEEIQELMSLAMLSPTSFNIQNWRFVVVKDKDLRQKIRVAAWDQAQVTDASLLVILCAHLKSWANPQRYWVNAPQPVQDFLVPMIEEFYKEKEQLQRDEAMRSCGIAAQTLMLAAKSLGYDSCPMVGYDAEQVAKLIKLPDDYVISMFVVIGKAVKAAWPRPGQLSSEEVIIENHF